MTPSAVARSLLDWIAEDDATRARLAANGSLFDGYHPEMRAVHERNADGLERIVAEGGWPSAERVGAEAAKAAWIIVQHAIARPDFQRAMLPLLWAEAKAGRVSKSQPAYLEDRIACHEGRHQTYGTQFDWSDDGQMSPLPIADPDGVDTRRAAVGLGPLADAIAYQRKMTRDDPRPVDPAARRRAAHDWAVSVGWRKA